MQRRAAALYGAFFLILAVGSFGMIAAASAPTVSIADPDHRLSDGSEFTANGQSYDATIDDGAATLAWTEADAEYSESWDHVAEVTFEGTDYEVAIPDVADPTIVELTEIRPLPEDIETTEINGTEYVVLEGEGDRRELVPIEEYLDETHGEAQTHTLEAGQTFDYRGNQTTLETVSNDSSTLLWTAPRTNTVDVAEGDVVELGGGEFVAHFPDANTLVLDRDVEAYERQIEIQATYDDRINGLWGVSILSSLAVVALLGLSYLSSRY